MRSMLIALSIVVALCIPAPAQAFSLKPIGHAAKVVGAKTLKAAEYSLLVTGMVVGAIAFCSTGACN